MSAVATAITIIGTPPAVAKLKMIPGSLTPLGTDTAPSPPDITL